MPVNRASRSRPSSRSKEISPNIIQEAIREIMGDFEPRPNAPDGSMSDLMRHLTTKSPAAIEQFLSTMNKEKEEVDLETFDYSKIPVTKNSFWIVQLMPDGFVSSENIVSQTYQPGYKSIFSLVIYDERSNFRIVDHPEPGLPSSEFILRCIKRAIASPMPPLRRSLPSLLIIALKLSPHVDALRPFLNSLPAPFEWRLETEEEAEEVAEGVYEKNKQGVSFGIQAAESEKIQGNQAIARKNRGNAVKHYTEAIECLSDAQAQKPTEQEQRAIFKALSVCLSNRAAAWLLDGQGQDPKKALADAERALKYDEDYGKAYYRQAKAHSLLSNQKAALESLTKALRRPALASDKGLNDYFVELYGGFPENTEELRKFCRNVFSGPESVRGLKGFEDRANKHVKKVFGAEASIESL